VGSYLGTVWRCRYFWLSLVRMDLRDRYRGSILGLGWSLINPLAMTAILSLVFSKLMHQDIRYYAPRLLGGLACWQFLLKGTLQGCQCFFRSQAYIRAHPMPAAIYPLRTALGETFHFLVSLAVVLGMARVLQIGPFNPLALLTLLPTLVLLFVLAWSLAVLAGFANVYFQDTQHLLEICFQLWFYATPIIYPPSVLLNNGLGWWLQVNPIVPFLDLIREPILEGRLPAPATFGLATLIVATMVTLAGIMLSRLQRKLIFHL
jgi:lipopolysaccharide transport system permease protein